MSMTIGGTGAHCGHFIASTTAPVVERRRQHHAGLQLHTGRGVLCLLQPAGPLIHDMGRGGKAHATRATIDDKAELPGFAAALERMGWLKFNEPLGTPMRWTSRLRKGYVTKKLAAQLVVERKARGDK